MLLLAMIHGSAERRSGTSVDHVASFRREGDKGEEGTAGEDSTSLSREPIDSLRAAINQVGRRRSDAWWKSFQRSCLEQNPRD